MFSLSVSTNLEVTYGPSGPLASPCYYRDLLASCFRRTAEQMAAQMPAQMPAQMAAQVYVACCEEPSDYDEAMRYVNMHNLDHPDNPIIWMLCPIYGGIFPKEQYQYWHFTRKETRDGVEVVLADWEDRVRSSTILQDLEFFPVTNGCQSFQFRERPPFLLIMDGLVDSGDFEGDQISTPEKHAAAVTHRHLIGVADRDLTLNPPQSPGIYLDTSDYELVYLQLQTFNEEEANEEEANEEEANEEEANEEEAYEVQPFPVLTIYRLRSHSIRGSRTKSARATLVAR